jgi:hypothetical protein
LSKKERDGGFKCTCKNNSNNNNGIKIAVVEANKIEKLYKVKPLKAN